MKFMDSFFGIGLPELVLILILAGIVMGPHRIRHVARTLGSIIAQMQLISRQFMRQLNTELDAAGSTEIKGAAQDLKELQREVASLRRQFSSLPNELLEEGKKATREAEETLRPATVTTEQLRREGTQPHQPASANQTQTTTGEVATEQLPVTPLPTPVDVADDPES